MVTTVALIVMCIGVLIFWVFPTQIMSAFNPSEEMMAIGIHCLRVISLAFPVAGASIMIATSFQAIGKAHVSMIASFIRQMIFLLPVSFLLSRIGGLDLVWYGFLISEIVCLAYELHMYRRYKRTIFSKWETVPAAV